MGKIFSKKHSSSKKQPENSSERSRRYEVQGESSQQHVAKTYQRAHDDGVLSLCPVLDGRILSGGQDKAVVLYDWREGKKEFTWNLHSRDISRVCYGQVKEIILSGSRDTSIKACRLGQSDPFLDIKAHDLIVSALALSPDNERFVSGSRDNYMKIWDLATGNVIAENAIAQNLITDVKWSGDDHCIVQASEDKEVKVWDSRSLKVVRQFARKQYIQTSCDISPDGRSVLTTSNGFQGNGCEATLWDLGEGKLVREFNGHQQTIGCGRFLPSNSDGKLVVTVSNDSSIRVWNQNSEDSLVYHSLGGAGSLTSIAVYDDDRICISSLEGGITLLHLDTKSSQMQLIEEAFF